MIGSIRPKYRRGMKVCSFRHVRFKWMDSVWTMDGLCKSIKDKDGVGISWLSSLSLLPLITLYLSPNWNLIPWLDIVHTPSHPPTCILWYSFSSHCTPLVFQSYKHLHLHRHLLSTFPNWFDLPTYLPTYIHTYKSTFQQTKALTIPCVTTLWSPYLPILRIFCRYTYDGTFSSFISSLHIVQNSIHQTITINLSHLISPNLTNMSRVTPPVNKFTLVLKRCISTTSTVASPSAQLKTKSAIKADVCISIPCLPYLFQINRKN